MNDICQVTPPSFRVTACGIEVRGEPAFDEWKAAFEQIAAASRSLMWAVGDMMVYGKAQYGEACSELLRASKYKDESLRVAEWVSRKFPPVTRVTELSFTHHREAAALPAAAAVKVLTEARDKGLSRRELKQVISRAKSGPPPSAPPADPLSCVTDSLQAMVASGRRYGTIYADPPWQYKNTATRAAAEDHYDTQGIDWLCSLPVKELAADYCHLHLWTTNAHLELSFRVMREWGFTYQGVFVWCKPVIGMGNCWRVSHEFLMLAIKGKPRKFAVHNLRSWGEFDRGEHSAKPEQVRAMIERASPGPYLEMFSRTTAQGWDAFGDQVACNDSLFAPAVEHITGDAA